MRVTKEQIKAEIDRLPEEDLGILYRIVLALEASPASPVAPISEAADPSPEEWAAFIARTYGSFAETPIERGDQSHPELRELLR